jgi:hypothetical protein
MKTFSSAVSSVASPLSLPNVERQPDPESVAATTTDNANINLSVDDHRRRSMTSTIDNAPALNNRGINQEKKGASDTVTGSLLQKPVTLAAANLGSYDKSPGKADTTVNPSGKTSTQIPQLPLGDNSSPWGDNAVCT